MIKHITPTLKIAGLIILFSCCKFLYAQTMYKDVAPIFYTNCTSCHHAGGITFPLTQYNYVNAMGSAILADLQSNKMPPWPADASYKHYAHERIVPAADKTLLINWINNGMLAGDTTLAPPIPIYGNSQLNSTPDLILNLPKFISTATTTDHYYCMNVPTGLLQDRYIRAFEFIPGNAALIHHAVITIDTTGTAVDDFTGGCYNFQGQINIGDFAPGMGPTVLPAVSPTKFGFRLKANSKMSFQIHVPEGTAGLQDSSQIRIFFYPINETGIRDMYFQTVLQNWNFYIPANSVTTVTQKYPTGTATIPVDVSLYGAFPHSHKTCTSILNYAYTSIDTIPLIRINNWDFHWQGQYTFTNMVKIPAGYKLFSSHVFDNTTNNPNTPNPNLAVTPGTSTTNEMLFDSYLYALYQAGDEFVNIDSLLSNDPLLIPTNVTNINNIVQTVHVFPNPFTSIIYFDYYLTCEKWVSIKLFNQLGQEVKTISENFEKSGIHTHSVEINNSLPKGVYYYKIQAGNNISSGKIILK